jgi:tRNA (cytidine/uridine-2'-O-)-methyltransferase
MRDIESDGRSGQDVAASAAAVPSSREERERPSLHIVLVEPEIAGNAGAIGRTCVAVGGMLWLVRPLGFFVDDRTLRRAGLDYWEHLKWKVVDSLEEVTEAAGTDRVWLFSARAARTYTDVAFKQGDVLVFGPESRGLSRAWLERYADRALRIPIQPEARSLNLGSAVAVAAFEALRQVGWPARAVEGVIGSGMDSGS